MKTLYNLTKRNCRLFFKDKGLFFTSLITPAILLVLYITFLAKTFKDSFLSYMGDFSMNESLIDAVVGGQLISSLLAVSCVTVAFCSNLLMVQDKVTGSIKDLRITPVRTSALAVGYFCSTAVATGIVGIVAFGLCLLYLAQMGFYMSLLDVLAVLLDVVLLTLFGTALSSAVNFHLSTNGQASAVGTVVSAGYGFICGAYMPVSAFSTGLQRVISFLPGTYGTFAQPLSCRGLARDGKGRYSKGNSGGNQKLHRLQPVLFRKQGVAGCHVSDPCRSYASASGGVYSVLYH